MKSMRICFAVDNVFETAFSAGMAQGPIQRHGLQLVSVCQI